MTKTFFSAGWPPEWPYPPTPPLPAPAPPPPTPLPHWTAAEPATGGDWLAERLFENRIVLVHGVIDRDAANRLNAELLALDSIAQRPIMLHIDSSAADLTAALLVADTLDLVRVSTHALVIGEVGGGSLALLMAAHHRLAYPHARVRLTQPRADTLSTDVTKAADRQAGLLAEFIDRMAQVTNRPAEEIAADLRRGRHLTAAQAVEYGLLDGIATHNPG